MAAECWNGKAISRNRYKTAKTRKQNEISLVANPATLAKESGGNPGPNKEENSTRALGATAKMPKKAQLKVSGVKVE